MRLARFTYIIFGVLILASCAQVGVLTGGEKDRQAPKPIEEKVTPMNATVNMTAKQVIIPFDEYFRLNDPRNSIRMVPPHATVEAEMKKKSLILSWEEELQANTTYAIYLNKAVKDITEGNDSIMQYVFSTGPKLDTFQYAVSVVDAKSGKAAKDIVVALYKPGTDELLNFAQTTSTGAATLKYLSPSTYDVLAFEDFNGDLELQEFEARGFIESSIQVDSNGFLNESIRLFRPNTKPEIRTLTYQAPGSFLLGTTHPFENEEVYFNGNLVDSSNYVRLASDSLKLFFPKDSITNGSISLLSTTVNDTATYRVIESRKRGLIRPSTKASSGVFAPSESIYFDLNDLIQSVDTSKITFTNKSDSSDVQIESFTIDRNRVYFECDRSDVVSIDCFFDNDAFTTLNGASLKTSLFITTNPARKYGALAIDLSYYQQPIVLDVYFEGKEFDRFNIASPTSDFQIDELLPGNYTFQIINDDNNNGKWDTGDLSTRTQPEAIDFYTTPTKVRANWDVEVSLIPLTATPTEDE